MAVAGVMPGARGRRRNFSVQPVLLVGQCPPRRFHPFVTMESGFVGRDKLWSEAWHYFLASPIIGNGAGFFDRYGVEIHNFFLYGLSEFGLLSLLIYGMIFFLFYDLYRTNKPWFFCFIGIPIFWIFNDRFFNINPYPFLLYIVLFAHANTYKDHAAYGPRGVKSAKVPLAPPSDAG